MRLAHNFPLGQSGTQQQSLEDHLSRFPSHPIIAAMMGTKINNSAKMIVILGAVVAVASGQRLRGEHPNQNKPMVRERHNAGNLRGYECRCKWILSCVHPYLRTSMLTLPSCCCFCRSSKRLLSRKRRKLEVTSSRYPVPMMSRYVGVRLGRGLCTLLLLLVSFISNLLLVHRSHTGTLIGTTAIVISSLLLSDQHVLEPHPCPIVDRPIHGQRQVWKVWKVRQERL